MEGQDFLAGLSEREDEQAENFEISTLKLVLGQLGATKKRVRDWQHSTPFDCSWFNRECFIGTYLLTARLKTVSLFTLMTRPTKSVLYGAWKAALEEAKADDVEALILVYDTGHSGRMVCTNVRLAGQSHLHVEARDLKFNITPFPGFFANRYGPVVGGHSRC